MSNSEQLASIMREHKLTAARVAKLVRCSRSTVYHWRTTYEMPSCKLALLKLQVGAPAQGGAA